MVIYLLVSQLIENVTELFRDASFSSHAVWHQMGLCCQSSNLSLFSLTSLCSHYKVCFRADLSLNLKLSYLSPPLLLSRYICLFLGKRKRETEVWYKRKEVRWVSEYTSCFLPCNLGRDTAQALRRYFCVSETRDLRCDRMTNYPGLPGTKDLPGKWTLNVKTRTAPEKPR